MRRALVSVAVVCAAGLLAMSQSSASQLPLAGAEPPFTTSLARCDDTVDATTTPTSGTSASVQVPSSSTGRVVINPAGTS